MGLGLTVLAVFDREHKSLFCGRVEQLEVGEARIDHTLKMRICYSENIIQIVLERSCANSLFEDVL